MCLPMVALAQAGDSESLPEDIVRNFNHPNQDLYLRIYDNITFKAPTLARKRVAHFIDFSEQDMNELTEGGYPEAVLEYCGDVQKDLVACRDEILEAYTLELEFFYLEQELEEESYATEIWSNGNLDDGNFDLLVDLNIIDLIVFGKRANVISSRFPEVSDNDNGAQNGAGESLAASNNALSDLNNEGAASPNDSADSNGTSGPSGSSLNNSGGSEVANGNSLIITVDESGGQSVSSLSTPTTVFSPQTLYQSPLEEYFATEHLIPFDESAETLNLCLDPAVLDLQLLRLRGLDDNNDDGYSAPYQPYAEQVPRGGLGYPQLPTTAADRARFGSSNAQSGSGQGGGADNSSAASCNGEMAFGLFCMEKKADCPVEMVSGEEDDPLRIKFGICYDIRFVNNAGDAGKNKDPKQPGAGNDGQNVSSSQVAQTGTVADKRFMGENSTVEYQESDNCINCHVVAINKIIRELLGIPLTPHRNTKTINYELGSAFDFLGSVGPMIEISYKPVPLVRNKDKDKWRDPAEEDKDGLSALFEHRTLTEKVDEAEQRVMLEEHNDYITGDRTYQSRLQRYSNATLDELQNQIREEQIAQVATRNAVLQELFFANRIIDNSNYWEAVGREFGYLYSNMRSVQRLFHYLGDTVSTVIREETAIECRVKQDQS